ncbi:MAG: hypothetical protein ACD_79C00585G0003 [uncultured bacterium]|nr:MAG: hypothetical protein ACD_79C00585G0003 [uncultured bacterium]
MVGISIKVKEVKIHKDYDQIELQSMLQKEIFKRHIAAKEKEAYERGIKDGIDQGFKQRNEDVLSLISTLKNVKEDFNNVKFDILRGYEPKLVDLALKIAEKVLGRELETGGVKLSNIISPILSKIPGVTKLIIKVNPKDFSILKEMYKDISQELTGADIEIIPDAKITAGGCLLETDMGMVDATIETRLEQIKESIKEM